MIRPVRLMTWNVNGLRAILQREKKRNVQELLDGLDVEIACFQETKLTRSEMDEELVRPAGYDAFYSFSKVRSGYSGVVTFCKTGVVPTIAAEEGLTGMWKVDDSVGHVGTAHLELSAKLLNELESEGRCVITDHQAFVLLNVYCPALASADRLEYKLAFHELLHDRVAALQRAGRRVVVVGDINISHKEIDHCDPSPYHDGAFGDHPCRQWMDRVVVPNDPDQPQQEHKAGQLVDSFRHFHPTRTKAFTCWNMVTAARQTNYGTRIDYILVDPELMDDSVVSCEIEPERTGSDHCPVVSKLVVQFDLDGEAGAKTASLCARFYAEFSGKQQTIKSYFAQPTADEDNQASESRFLTYDSSTSSSKKFKGGKQRSGQQSIMSFFAQPSKTNGVKKSVIVGSVKTTELPSSVPESNYPQEIQSNPEWMMILGSKRKASEEEQNKWKQVLSGQPPKTPMCHCGQPTVMRSVLKINENWGRKFFVCTKPAGEKGNPDARCEFFQWADQRGNKKQKR
ncbi:hypothetical protein Poli38472_002367 [Pythium oligandrum]|uniref:DNA-(apurinic or apyrimidinic site) endonuclease n=1 Tax=Pythium oligandrum TaxID=41045 RepID=A0A8K1CH33_PYTOL|nr:hypothetical protein Poli38472_002367 [Pythium oligandrum]|eukprot:TMW63426.1 hypothetical protein Poli38472_002367 [Pythium oligandrum]